MALITMKTGQLLCGKPFAFKSHHRCTLRPVCASRNESEITVSPTKTDEEAVLERDDISEGVSNIIALPSRLSLRTKLIKTIAKSRVKSRTLGLQGRPSLQLIFSRSYVIWCIMIPLGMKGIPFPLQNLSSSPEIE